ncbi:MAG: hypothetical protein AAGF74_10435 [Pseudomonadota bacterium]
MIEIAALVYAAACVGIIGFQVCLIAGAPWGHVTQGGQHDGPLPTAGRIFAGVSILLLSGMALAIMSVAGFWPGWPGWTVWPALAVQVLTTVLNWITRSPAERRLWAPIMTAMLALAVFVWLGA